MSECVLLGSVSGTKKFKVDLFLQVVRFFFPACSTDAQCD